MDELELNEELYYGISNWMRPKYALGTIHQRLLFLKKISKKYKVLNKETLRLIMRSIKYQHQRAVLVMINSYCYDSSIDFNLRIPSIKSQANKLPELLSIEEVKLMISATPKPYDLAIRCIFNMGAGLRVSEVIKMMWGHIHWIDWINNKENYGVANIKSGKGSKDRIVNIPRNLMNDLYNYAKELDILNEFGVPVGGMIFKFGADESNFKRELMGADIELWKEEYIRSKYNWFRYHILQRVCEKALNKHIKIHSLRHLRATYLYEIEKVPIERIGLLLGHKDLSTTRIYTKINPITTFELVKDTKEI